MVKHVGDTTGVVIALHRLEFLFCSLCVWKNKSIYDYESMNGHNNFILQNNIWKGIGREMGRPLWTLSLWLTSQNQTPF